MRRCASRRGRFCASFRPNGLRSASNTPVCVRAARRGCGFCWTRSRAHNRRSVAIKRVIVIGGSGWDSHVATAAAWMLSAAGRGRARRHRAGIARVAVSQAAARGGPRRAVHGAAQRARLSPPNVPPVVRHRWAMAFHAGAERRVLLRREVAHCAPGRMAARRCVGRRVVVAGADGRCWRRPGRAVRHGPICSAIRWRKHGRGPLRSRLTRGADRDRAHAGFMLMRVLARADRMSAVSRRQEEAVLGRGWGWSAGSIATRSVNR